MRPKVELMRLDKAIFTASEDALANASSSSRKAYASVSDAAANTAGAVVVVSGMARPRRIAPRARSHRPARSCTKAALAQVMASSPGSRRSRSSGRIASKISSASSSIPRAHRLNPALNRALRAASGLSDWQRRRYSAQALRTAGKSPRTVAA